MNCPIFWFEKRNFIGDHERAEKNNSQTLPARWGRWRPGKGYNKAREWSRVLRIFPTISRTVEQSTYELAHHHGIEQSCSKSYKICCFWRGRKRNRLLVFIEKLLIHLFAGYMSFFYVACPMSYTLQDPPSVLLLSLKGELYCSHFVGSKGFFVSNLLLSSNRCKSFFFLFLIT